ncbi:MAG TPA: TetR/AcrR family transcriptional regulator [Tepidiformaceae bacterium]|nr:TetR/AcrR family transcriptional regulator [Tepidiformaceae bacterium]
MTKVTQAHIDARMGDILGAALRVFGQKGTAAATMQEIATEAGLSAGAIYRYFTNKDDLITAVYENAILENRRMFREAAEGATSPLQALTLSGYRAMNDTAEGGCLDLDLAIASSRYGGAMTGVYRTMLDEVAVEITALLDAAKNAGEIGQDLDTRLLARVLMAFIDGLRLQALDPDTAVNPNEAIDLMANLLRCTAAPSGLPASAS